jgi:hypothetical protein
MKALFLILAFLMPWPVLAQFKLEAEYPAMVTQTQRRAFDARLREIERLLPASMKRVLNRSIKITFRPQRDTDGPWCNERSKIRSGFFQSTGNASEIQLDQSLLAPDKLDKPFEIGAECAPGSAVLQNLSLLYDANPNLSTADAQLKVRCEDNEYRSQNGRECSNVQSLEEGRISAQPVFLKLRNWDSTRSSKGELVQRSPDASEFTRSKYAFAVNTQLFLSDPEFACRRPATAKYLEKALAQKPFPEPRCKTNYELYTQSHPDPLTIDKSKIYQVHYLWAGPGEAAMSRWGHSMIRIVQCAPHRTVVDEKCMEDTDHHLVVSYRAYVDEMSISTWKGLTGEYPSQLLVMRYKDVVNEYTRGEQRDVFSLPLKLNKEKRDFLVDNVVEQYWNYRGRYKFLSTNCATETKDLLQIVDDGGALSSFANDDTLTPSYLFESLQRQGFAEDISKLSKKELLERKLLVEADESFLKKPYARLRAQVREMPEKIDDFYKKLSPSERFKYFQALPEEKKKAAAPVFYMLELNAKQVKQTEMDKKLFQMLEAYKENKSHPLNELIVKYQERLKALNAALQPWELPKEGVGYGVPRKDELKAENPVAGLLAEREKIILELQKIVPQLLPKDWEELQKIRAQMDLYRKAASREAPQARPSHDASEQETSQQVESRPAEAGAADAR